MSQSYSGCRTRPMKGLAWISFISLASVLYFQHEIMLFVLNYTPYHAVGYSFSEEELPQKPPEKPAPLVLLHTYMRGGSSLLGSIFDRNPNVLYYFEPLYTLYQAAMNTEHYRLQPLHVYAYPNGTLRKQTSFEETFVFDKLFDLMDCKVHKLQMEHIATAFVSRSQALRPYEKCIGTFTLAQRNYCTTHTSKLCGGFISDAMKNKCHVFMAYIHQDMETVNKAIALKSKDVQTALESFKDYKTCLKDVYYHHAQCKHIYKERCDFSHLRVAKLVRSNVKFLRRVLQNRKDVFVIYQPRDPRGMLSSKKSLGFLTFDIQTEAKLECQILCKEYKEILQLRAEYPQKVMILRYEDLAEDVFEWTKKIYKFVGMDLPQMVFDSIKSSMGSFQPFDIKFSTSRQDGKAAAWVWKKKMVEKDRKIVEEACKDFFDLDLYDL